MCVGEDPGGEEMLTGECKVHKAKGKKGSGTSSGTWGGGRGTIFLMTRGPNTAERKRRRAVGVHWPVKQRSNRFGGELKGSAMRAGGGGPTRKGAGGGRSILKRRFLASSTEKEKVNRGREGMPSLRKPFPKGERPQAGKATEWIKNLLRGRQPTGRTPLRRDSWKGLKKRPIFKRSLASFLNIRGGGGGSPRRIPTSLGDPSRSPPWNSSERAFRFEDYSRVDMCCQGDRNRQRRKRAPRNTVPGCAPTRAELPQ